MERRLFQHFVDEWIEEGLLALCSGGGREPRYGDASVPVKAPALGLPAEIGRRALPAEAGYEADTLYPYGRAAGHAARTINNKARLDMRPTELSPTEISPPTLKHVPSFPFNDSSEGKHVFLEADLEGNFPTEGALKGKERKKRRKSLSVNLMHT